MDAGLLGTWCLNRVKQSRGRRIGQSEKQKIQEPKINPTILTKAVHTLKRYKISAKNDTDTVLVD